MSYYEKFLRLKKQSDRLNIIKIAGRLNPTTAKQVNLLKIIIEKMGIAKHPIIIKFNIW